MMLVMCYCRPSTFKVWGGEARTLCGALGAVEWMKNKEGLQGTAEDATGNRVIPGLPSHYSLCDLATLPLCSISCSVKWMKGSEEPQGPSLHSEIHEQHFICEV